jgi:hypothetical protein
VAAAGCGPKTPDYQSIWSTTPTTTSAAPTEQPIPFSQYLQSNGVSGSPVDPGTLTDLTVSIPTPPGWQRINRPNIPTTTELIAGADAFPNAMLVVFKLGGADFNAAELVPSSMIEGSYNLGDQRLHTINRIVIAHGPGEDADQYLIQLAVTSLADKAIADAVDIEKIIHGFTVAAK